MKSFTDFTPGKTITIYERSRVAVSAISETGMVATAGQTSSLFTLLVQTFGATLLFMSIFSTVYLVSPMIAAEVAYRFKKPASQSIYSSEPVEKKRFAQINQAAVDSQTPITQPVSSEFGIVIPKISVNTTVIPDVDAANADVYTSALTRGVAHARGTGKPGEGRNIFIFGHSTDFAWNITNYNAQFYLLKELTLGDEIELIYNDKRFLYRVESTHITDATDVNLLTPHFDKETLILQTCWPPGTTWKRYIVQATKT